jgi:hypothetical protein
MIKSPAARGRPLRKSVALLCAPLCASDSHTHCAAPKVWGTTTAPAAINQCLAQCRKRTFPQTVLSLQRNRQSSGPNSVHIVFLVLAAIAVLIRRALRFQDLKPQSPKIPSSLPGTRNISSPPLVTPLPPPDGAERPRVWPERKQAHQASPA